MFIKLWLSFAQVGKVRRQQIENGTDCVKHKTPSVSQVRREQNRHVLRDTIPLLEVSSLFYLFFYFLATFSSSGVKQLECRNCKPINQGAAEKMVKFKLPQGFSDLQYVRKRGYFK